jgi:hypothetical protein
MSTVVERLRASREQYIANEKRYGHEAGRKWAEDKASYLDLTRIALISDPPSADGWALTALYKVVDPDEQLDGEDVARYLNLHPNDITDEFAAAFIEGAKEVYNEVKDQI